MINWQHGYTSVLKEISIFVEKAEIAKHNKGKEWQTWKCLALQSPRTVTEQNKTKALSWGNRDTGTAQPGIKGKRVKNLCDRELTQLEKKCPGQRSEPCSYTRHYLQLQHSNRVKRLHSPPVSQTDEASQRVETSTRYFSQSSCLCSALQYNTFLKTWVLSQQYQTHSKKKKKKNLDCLTHNLVSYTILSGTFSNIIRM